MIHLYRLERESYDDFVGVVEAGALGHAKKRVLEVLKKELDEEMSFKEPPDNFYYEETTLIITQIQEWSSTGVPVKSRSYVYTIFSWSD